MDTLGLLRCVLVTAASGHDHAGTRPLLDLLSRSCHRVRLVWAEGDYAGTLVCWAGAHPGLTVPVVKPPTEATGFVVLPGRWVVTRTLVNRPPPSNLTSQRLAKPIQEQALRSRSTSRELDVP